MSSSDAQPPLTRRQARERERAGETGALPVTPPPNVPTATPVSSAEAPRRRPGSHAAPSMSAPRSVPAQPPTAPAAPASATEIIPGTGMTRRQLRAQRAVDNQGSGPVPLQAPSPQSSDRTVAEVLDSVAVVEGRQHAGESNGTSAPDVSGSPERTSPEDAPESDDDGRSAAAAPTVPGATESAHAEPVVHGTAEPVAHGTDEAPAGAHRTAADERASEGAASGDPLSGDSASGDTASGDTASGDHASGHTAPEDTASGDSMRDVPALVEVEAAPDAAAFEQATVADGSPAAIEPLSEAVEHGDEPRRHRSTWAPHGSDESADDDVVSTGAPVEHESSPSLRLPLPSEVPSPREAGVFPLDLDSDTAEVPAQSASEPSTPRTPVRSPDPADSLPATAPDDTIDHAPVSRPMEPKPMAFAAPAGHWSRQGEGVDDSVHESETGIRRVTDSSTAALILPTSGLGDVTGALNATGEVILTGSIDLPKSLSSTGSHRPIDGAEVDRLLEQHDEQPETDASPVRASRAVSSHTSTRAVVLAAAKPKQSRLPTVLAVGAAAVGVAGVAALVVASFALHVFG